MGQGLIFFDGYLHIPAAPSILDNVLHVLWHAKPRHTEQPTLSSRLPPSMTHNNSAPTSIFLGCSMVSITIVVFINNLARQLICIDNAHITPAIKNCIHDLMT
jgi:hypothetical protein